MPEPLTTLPGDIPGLLRRGSPVRYLDSAWRSSPEPNTDGVCDRWVVNHVHPSGVWWVGGNLHRPHHLWLDLTDATARAQAAAWADKATTHDTIEFMQRLDAGTLPSLDERRAMDLGMRFADMTPEQIDTLARLCMRLAGRAS